MALDGHSDLWFGTDYSGGFGYYSIGSGNDWGMMMDKEKSEMQKVLGDKLKDEIKESDAAVKDMKDREKSWDESRPIVADGLGLVSHRDAVTHAGLQDVTKELGKLADVVIQNNGHVATVNVPFLGPAPVKYVVAVIMTALALGTYGIVEIVKAGRFNEFAEGINDLRGKPTASMGAETAEGIAKIDE